MGSSPESRTRRHSITSVPLAGPVRTCAGCRERALRSALVRLVLAGPASVVVDPARSAPGRGTWLHPDQGCLDLAVRRRSVGRALRATQPVQLDDVQAWFDRHVRQPAPDAQADHRVIDEESGLEADGHPMSTQR